jgi:tetratricopeptide (TPR) repeat protein
MLLGQCQLSLKQYAKAEASFKQAMELDPKQATAERYLSLAEAQLAADGFVGAEASAVAAFRLDGSSAKAQAIQGLAKLGQMRDKVGLGHLDINDPISKAVRSDPQLSGWVLGEMSRIKPGYRIVGLGNEAQAGRIEDQIARANAIGMEAMALGQKGDYKSAADTMLRCADAYPVSQPGITCTIRMQAIQLRFQSGDNEAALADADRTIQLFPDLPPGYFARYIALKLLNRNDDAEATKQKLVEMKAPEVDRLEAALQAIQAQQSKAKP